MTDQPAAPAAEQPKPEEQQDVREQLPVMLQGFEGAPTQADIEKWKAEHGEVYVSGFSETELFVWRPVTRPEYVQLQAMAQDPNNQMDQFKLEELLCDTCVIWKSPGSRDWNSGKGGTPQTLSEQIMTHSNFLNPAAASMLVAKL